MEKDRYFKDWTNFSQQNDFDLHDHEEITKPLNNVKKVRDLATQINILQLNNFTDEDEGVGEVFTSIDKDILMDLSDEIINYFEIEKVTEPEKEAKIFVSAKSTDLYFGIAHGNKRIKYVFDPKTIFLISKKEIFESGDWLTDKEDLPSEYADPDKLLGIFKNRLGQIEVIPRK